jgi:glycosyltransferase involved in cell wall biosynthesis
VTAASGTEAAWVCCHLGAREHYVVPRALHQAGRLHLMITDAWQSRSIRASVAAGLSARFGQRFHAELADAPVRSLSQSLIAHEFLWRLQRRDGWSLLMARNNWFQQRAAAALSSLPKGRRAFVFAHSYSAGEILAEGRRRGWKTVLGQIDPGPQHVITQERLAAERREFGPPPPAPPPEYFDSWRRECELADWIVVNSDWSRESLVRTGIPERKLRTIPLPYEPEPHAEFTREYPAAFTTGRPLRALFVGTASVAKGVADLLLAFDLLEDAPIELSIVGDRAMDIPERFLHHPRVHWLGRVDRAAVMNHYRSGDLLVFPSHSDGFGMAQIEAHGWGLPIVASRHCGRVVREGETGYLLPEVTPQAIAATLRRAMSEPETLVRYARNARATPGHDVAALAHGLIALESE